MWFWYERAFTGHWSPVKSPTPPGKRLGGYTPRIVGTVALPPDEWADDLHALARRYPAPPEDPAPVPPPPPKPDPTPDAIATEVADGVEKRLKQIYS